ncbi:hypothetical protein [Salinivibrio costicola]|jgi:hypothetical protein|uniref:hypothetical protein n=1 Tax=Salinivibrio costicola TaxID=51367 RepID=UPI003F72FE0F
MKTITTTQFIELLKTATITPNHGVDDVCYSDDDFRPDMVEGWIANELKVDGLTISYQNACSHPRHKPSLVEVSNDIPEVWIIEKQKFNVVDDEGDTLDKHDIGEIIADNTDIEEMDLSILGDDEQTDIDVDEDSDMETFTLDIDNAPNIRFTGEQIGSASSSDNQAMGSSYSGQTGRWTELYLYKTKGGKYICHQIGCTRWIGEHARYSGQVCETLDEVKAFFGHRWLAKELYDDAGIDCAVDVE